MPYFNFSFRIFARYFFFVNRIFHFSMHFVIQIPNQRPANLPTYLLNTWQINCCLQNKLPGDDVLDLYHRNSSIIYRMANYGNINFDMPWILFSIFRKKRWLHTLNGFGYYLRTTCTLSYILYYNDGHMHRFAEKGIILHSKMDLIRLTRNTNSW